MIAHLGMYPFAHLRGAYDDLWAAIRSRLGDGPDQLDRDIDPHTAWHASDLLLGQTCGWPLIQELADEVTVVGAFDVRVPFAAAGCYRSVIVASKPIGLDEWKADPATVVARNGDDSLSGWVSLQWAWGGVPGNVLTTGGHVSSLRAVASGEAQVASIDAMSFEFAAESEPVTVGRVHAIGHGPVVGTLPLIMSASVAQRLDEVRSALAAAVADPAMSAVCARLRIRGFVPCGFEHYASLPELLPAR